MTRACRALFISVASAALIFPLYSSAAVIAGQPSYSEIQLINGDVPMIFSGLSELSLVRTPITHATGTVRSARVRYDILSVTGAGNIEVYLKECPTAETVGGYPSCRYIVSRDQKYGWDGVYIHPPDPDGGEIVFDFRSATDFRGTDYTDGVPLDPTRSYSLELVIVPNSFRAAVFGRSVSGGFEDFYTLDDAVATPAPPPPPPQEPSGKTYGDIGSDFSFPANGSTAAFQNLGNGSFAEGNKVTGMDIRVGTHPGNMIQAAIREFDNSGQIHEYFGNYIYTAEGEHVYRYDLPEQFTPDPTHCYVLLFYQQYTAPDSTYYGHSSDVYHASTTGCMYGFNTDNHASLLQNPSLNVPGYIDYSFRIHTDGPTTTPACTVNCFDNVLFLPGIEASRLYRPDGGGGDKRIWEPPLIGHDNAQLAMTGSGTSVRSDIYTKDPLGSVLGVDVYDSFLSTMHQFAKTNGIEFEAYPYDWRYGADYIASNPTQLATTTVMLLDEIKRLATNSKTGKITIIAHSNGGLVAKEAMLLLGPDASKYVDRLIFVAVPQVGTPQAIAGLLHGFNEALPQSAIPLLISDSEARTLGSNMPGAFGLLPTSGYFSSVNTPVVTFTPTLPDWVSRYGSTINSQSGMGIFLTDNAGRTQPIDTNLNDPYVLSSNLLSQSQTMHNAIDAWVPPSGIQLIQIAGWGVPTTVSGISYASTSKSVFCSGVCSSGLTSSINTTIDGDGTVVVPSALWTSTTTGAINYWLDLNDYNSKHFLANIGLLSTEHAEILTVPSLLHFISDIITKNVRPLSSYTDIFNKTPDSAQTRLRYTLHSPLTLNLYDNLGHHTGVSTTTGEIEEQIPGTYYTEFGDVKYIFSDASSLAHIIMEGYATSTFTFNVDELLGDTLVASTTFQDIPTTPDTIVTLDTSSGVAAFSPIHIDTNGDGTPDINLVPKLNGTVTVDTTPPVTVASTAGALGTNGWYTSNVLVTLNATDTESGVKATHFSLDGAATTTGTTVSITSEGLHALKFYSDDNAGNIEIATSTIIKLDKTAPEAKLIFNPATQLLDIIGIDNLSSITVQRTATSSTITDEAGHTLRLVFTQAKAKVGRIALVFNKLLYDGVATSTASPTSMKYKWNANTNGSYKMFASFLTSGTSSVETHFRPKRNVTILTFPPTDLNDSDDDASDNRPVRQALSGMVVPYMLTNKGAVSIGF